MSLSSPSCQFCEGLLNSARPGFQARALKIPCAQSAELVAGDLWVTVSARDFHTRFCRNLEEKNQPLPVPSPSATISDTLHTLVLGYPVTSRQHARSTGPSLGDHLSRTC